MEILKREEKKKEKGRKKREGREEGGERGRREVEEDKGGYVIVVSGWHSRRFIPSFSHHLCYLSFSLAADSFLRSTFCHCSRCCDHEEKHLARCTVYTHALLLLSLRDCNLFPIEPTSNRTADRLTPLPVSRLPFPPPRDIADFF